MTNDHPAVDQALRRIEATFGRDFGAWRACFDLPCPFVIGRRRRILDADSSESDWGWPALRARGFDRTRLDSHRVQVLTDVTALVDGAFTRLRDDGTSLETLGALYVCRLTDEGWKACLVVPHAYDEPAVAG